MNREDYFNNALKIFDKRNEYSWWDYPKKQIFPVETVSISSYYETLVSEVKGYEMYLVFAKYEYYRSISEEDNVLLSDYVMIFYLKNSLSRYDIQSLIKMDSKEYNTLLMESDRDFGDYLLPEVIRKITELDRDVEDFFNDL
ncbi:hypothetical protein K4R74_11945 [Staphylococcus epidermidis]|nr:hypothetical protein [Staphylococcus epidermidis]